jgi:hypothetical protein
VRVVGHRNVRARFDRYRLTRGYNTHINTKQFNTRSEWPDQYRYPDLYYEVCAISCACACVAPCGSRAGRHHLEKRLIGGRGSAGHAHLGCGWRAARAVPRPWRDGRRHVGVDPRPQKCVGRRAMCACVCVCVGGACMCARISATGRVADPALCTGDFFIWASPNCGNPQKAQRYPIEWAAALRKMSRLQPDLLLPGHGPPMCVATMAHVPHPRGV